MGAARSTEPNTRYLAGIACPSCGNTGAFSVRATTLVIVDDDGPVVLDQTSKELSWDDGSEINCHACDLKGLVATFRGSRDEQQQGDI